MVSRISIIWAQFVAYPSIEEWQNFMSEPTVPADFTKSGNRKRMSYERILEMVSRSIDRSVGSVKFLSENGQKGDLS